MMTPKILVLSGSDRSGSFNKKLAQAAAGILALIEPDVTMIALADYPLPSAADCSKALRTRESPT